MARTPRNVTTDALVMALACGATVEHAARKAGLSERSVYRRLARPAFRAQVSQARLELLQRTAGMLAGAGAGAGETPVGPPQDNPGAAAGRRRGGPGGPTPRAGPRRRPGRQTPRPARPPPRRCAAAGGIPFLARPRPRGNAP